MLGWTIFRKSVLHVFSNFGEAIKIGGSIMLLTHILIIGVIYLAISKFVPQGMYGKDWIVFLGLPTAIGLTIVQGLSFFWIAISWHRFLLLNETTSGLLPKWSNHLLLAYFRKSFLIFALMILIALLMAIPIYILANMGVLTGITGILGGALMVMPVAYLGMRISAILPAIAIGKSISVSAMMGVTRPYRGAIALLAFLSLLVNGLPSYLIDNISRGTMAQTILTLIFSWLQVMLSISILTTLYGFLFEDRSLD